jgi:hypothetical protein
VKAMSNANNKPLQPGSSDDNSSNTDSPTDPKQVGKVQVGEVSTNKVETAVDVNGRPVVDSSGKATQTEKTEGVTKEMIQDLTTSKDTGATHSASFSFLNYVEDRFKSETKVPSIFKFYDTKNGSRRFIMGSKYAVTFQDYHDALFNILSKGFEILIDFMSVKKKFDTTHRDAGTPGHKVSYDLYPDYVITNQSSTDLNEFHRLALDADTLDPNNFRNSRDPNRHGINPAYLPSNYAHYMHIFASREIPIDDISSWFFTTVFNHLYLPTIHKFTPTITELHPPSLYLSTSNYNPRFDFYQFFPFRDEILELLESNDPLASSVFSVVSSSVNNSYSIAVNTFTESEFRSSLISAVSASSTTSRASTVIANALGSTPNMSNLLSLVSMFSFPHLFRVDFNFRDTKDVNIATYIIILKLFLPSFCMSRDTIYRLNNTLAKVLFIDTLSRMAGVAGSGVTPEALSNNMYDEVDLLRLALRQQAAPDEILFFLVGSTADPVDTHGFADAGTRRPISMNNFNRTNTTLDYLSGPRLPGGNVGYSVYGYAGGPLPLQRARYQNFIGTQSNIYTAGNRVEIGRMFMILQTIVPLIPDPYNNIYTAVEDIHAGLVRLPITRKLDDSVQTHTHLLDMTLPTVSYLKYRQGSFYNGNEWGPVDAYIPSPFTPHAIPDPPHKDEIYTKTRRSVIMHQLNVIVDTFIKSSPPSAPWRGIPQLLNYAIELSTDAMVFSSLMSLSNTFLRRYSLFIKEYPKEDKFKLARLFKYRRLDIKLVENVRQYFPTPVRFIVDPMVMIISKMLEHKHLFGMVERVDIRNNVITAAVEGIRFNESDLTEGVEDFQYDEIRRHFVDPLDVNNAFKFGARPGRFVPVLPFEIVTGSYSPSYMVPFHRKETGGNTQLGVSKVTLNLHDITGATSSVDTSAGEIPYVISFTRDHIDRSIIEITTRGYNVQKNRLPYLESQAAFNQTLLSFSSMSI